jgi:cytochrome b561
MAHAHRVNSAVNRQLSWQYTFTEHTGHGSAVRCSAKFAGASAGASAADNDDCDKSLAERTEELHKTLATAGYFLSGLHAAAALFHHYVQRDNTLRRMLPPGR